MKIPWAIPDIGAAEKAAVAELFDINWLSQGPKVKEFETKLAGYFGRRHSVAVSNGTVALDLALKVLGIGAGDEVILPAMTYIATGSMVLNQGAVPVFADIDRETMTMSAAAVKAVLTDKTKAVMTMDYGGNACRYDELEEICRGRNIPILVDAAQSLAGTYAGSPLGSYGAIATVSFHSAKLMTTVEGGMIVTDNEDYARQLRILRNQGEDPEEKYKHIVLGFNARLTDMQAAIGLVQFAKLEQYAARRRQIAEKYNAAFAKIDEITTIKVTPGGTMGWFLFPIIVEARDAVDGRINASGVDTRLCYHLPLYRQPLFAEYSDNYCENAEWVSARVINLPIYAGLTDAEVDYIIENVKESVVK